MPSSHALSRANLASMVNNPLTLGTERFQHSLHETVVGGVTKTPTYFLYPLTTYFPISNECNYAADSVMPGNMRCLNTLNDLFI
jgi:hypothetical protein